MIKLSIVKSPDREVLGHYETQKINITIGSSCRNDLVISDSEIISSHLRLKLTSQGLLVKNINRVPYFFSNGKKVSGEKLHVKGDSFLLGQTKVEILELSYQKEFDVRAELQQRVGAITKKQPLVANLLQLIRDEILNPRVTSKSVAHGQQQEQEHPKVAPATKQKSKPVMARANEGKTMIARLADIFKDG